MPAAKAKQWLHQDAFSSFHATRSKIHWAKYLSGAVLFSWQQLRQFVQCFLFQLELHRPGHLERAIAKIVGKNRRTVARIIERSTVANHGADIPNWAKLVDWEKVHLAVSRGVQINVLVREHGEGKIGYVHFWRGYHKKYPNHPIKIVKCQAVFPDAHCLQFEIISTKFAECDFDRPIDDFSEGSGFKIRIEYR